MVEINLLPWRELAAQHEKKGVKKFFLLTILSSFTIVLLFTFVLNHYLTLKEKQYNEWCTKLLNLESLKQNDGQEIVNSNSRTRFPLKNQFNPYSFLKKLGQRAWSGICFSEINLHNQCYQLAGQANSWYDLNAWLVTAPQKMDMALPTIEIHTKNRKLSFKLTFFKKVNSLKKTKK